MYEWISTKDESVKIMGGDLQGNSLIVSSREPDRWVLPELSASLFQLLLLFLNRLTSRGKCRPVVGLLVSKHSGMDILVKLHRSE